MSDSITEALEELPIVLYSLDFGRSKPYSNKCLESQRNGPNVSSAGKTPSSALTPTPPAPARTPMAIRDFTITLPPSAQMKTPACRCPFKTDDSWAETWVRFRRNFALLEMVLAEYHKAKWYFPNHYAPWSQGEMWAEMYDEYGTFVSWVKYVKKVIKGCTGDILD